MKTLLLAIRLTCVSLTFLGFSLPLAAEDDSSCCGGQTLGADEECCVDTPYDAASYYCCHGQTFSKSGCPEADGSYSGGKVWNPDTCFCDCQVFPSMCEPQGKFVDLEECQCTCPPHDDPPDACSYWNEDTCAWEGGAGTNVSASIVAPTEDAIIAKDVATSFAGLGSNGCPDGETGYTFAWSSVPSGMEAAEGTSISQKSPKMKFTSPGHYVITFAATDALGATSTATAGINVPEIEIEVNETPDAKDDVVPLNKTSLAGDVKAKGRIRNTASGQTKDITVFLADSTGRLHFGDDKGTFQVTVKKDGSWTDFEIRGASKSTAIGDAKIEAHLDSATGAILKSHDATVFYFDGANVEVTLGANSTYAIHSAPLSAVEYEPDVLPAVHLKAYASLKPSDLDITVRPLKTYKVDVCQTLLSNNQSVFFTWDQPTFTWSTDPAVVALPSGTTATASSSQYSKIQIPYDAMDTVGGGPTYDDESDLVSPRQTSSSTDIISTSDSPRALWANTVDVEVKANGIVYGKLTYTHRARLKITSSFRVWCVVWNKDNETEVIPLRQSSWSIAADTDVAVCRPVVPSSDNAVTNSPVIDGEDSNSMMNDPKNEMHGDYGTATQVFTKP